MLLHLCQLARPHPKVHCWLLSASQFESKLFKNGAVACFMIRVACRVKAHHAFTFLIYDRFLPAAEVIIEGFGSQCIIGVVRVSPGGVGGRSSSRFTILTNRALPGVLVIVCALIYDGLQTRIRKHVASKMKLLDHCLIF